MQSLEVSASMFCRDAVIVSVLDSVTSVFAGLVIFSIIGYMADVLEQNIEDVATEGIMICSYKPRNK